MLHTIKHNENNIKKQKFSFNDLGTSAEGTSFGFVNLKNFKNKVD